MRVGNVAGLRISASPSAAVATVALWAVLGAAALFLLDTTPGRAVAMGLAGTAAHWLAVMGHHLGHAWAARRTGYPMTGVRLWGLLGSSVYPLDEPRLPAEVHIRRALGGPLASLLISALSGALVMLLRPVAGTLWWVALFSFLDNLLLQTLGALAPLGFTDGSTLLTWLRRR
jgi:hypothetical protein